MNKEKAFIDLLKYSNKLVVFTGAGVSAASGVPTFRDPGGLWDKYQPHQLANEEAFRDRPSFVWQWYQWRRDIIQKAGVNSAHKAIAKIQQHKSSGFQLVTQNVDGLHFEAGNSGILCLHGDIQINKCIECESLYDGNVTGIDEPPECHECGGLVRPGVVWFGESLDPSILNRSIEAAENCDLFIVIGTSAQVQPAASLISIAKRAGAKLVEFNPSASEASSIVDIFFQEPVEDSLPKLVDLCFPDDR